MKIIKRQLLIWKNKDIEKFHKNEQDTFYNYVDNASDTSAFENNWSYILQATRGEGLKIEKYQSVIYFWLRKKDELVIVHRLGKNHIKIIEELTKFCKKAAVNIVIKNVEHTAISNLENIGFEIKKHPWSNYSLMDDNTFPQIVSDVQGIIQLKPSALRESHRLNIKRFLRKRDIQVRLYSDDFEKTAHKLLMENSKYLENKHVESRKEVYDAHLFFFDKNIKYNYRLAYEEDNKQIAFGFFTVRKGIIYWNALVNEDQSNLMLFLMWQGIKYITEISEETIEKLALQGCETEGQYKWKQGFYPLKTLEKIHMYCSSR